MMKKALTFAAIAEAVTGLALLLVPSLIGLALFGEELTGVGVLSGRVTGIALIALSIACWPGPPFAGMLIYSAAVASYFAYVGFVNGLTGLLLWPAVVLHLVVVALLVRAWKSETRRRHHYGGDQRGISTRYRTRTNELVRGSTQKSANVGKADEARR